MTPAGGWPAVREDYLAALRTGDRATALGIVHGLHAGGEDVLAIVNEVLAPAQRRVGEEWVRDAWSVAQEHAATAISEAALHSLAVRRDPDAADDDRPVVVSCVEQEWHALPALMVAEHLRAAGHPVSYLGANASAAHLVRHIHDVGPRAVLISCSLSSFLPLVRRQIEAVRETGTPVVVGGAAFDPAGRRAEVLGANAYAGSAAEVPALVDRLPAAVGPAAPLTHPGAEDAYLVFGDREALADEVERLLSSSLATAHVSPIHADDQSWLRVVDDQLPHLVGSVAGALVTGDGRVVAEVLDWAETVLAHRDAPVEVGPALRRALHVAVRDVPVAATMLASLLPR